MIKLRDILEDNYLTSSDTEIKYDITYTYKDKAYNAHYLDKIEI